MSLFQDKILKKFLVNDEIAAPKFANYLAYKAKTNEIKNFKEEEFQDGFLRDIFENCLDYVLKSSNPKDFSLEREKKNEKDSKKADGAILVDGKVVGVIELKSFKTKNLDEVARQAFWYLNQNSNAHYVVVSNFDELRFYIDKATNYEKFSLFNLGYEEFKKLYTILSFESIKQNLALKLQTQTNEFEQEISKKLYKDFSSFRQKLFENLVKNNENFDKIELLKVTSKLCDRFIFMLFAEDRNLIPDDTIKTIINQFENQPFDDYSLYEFFKRYFEAINSGSERLKIASYNGGLFAKDEFLDSLKIDDEILQNNIINLSNYDFESEISVNILGHIFEQSLSDLEEIEANLNDQNFDKTKSKRKKDGVFYTPKFITYYIVQNTLGKLCEQKRSEFDIQNIVQNLAILKSEIDILESKNSKAKDINEKITNLKAKQNENLQILENYKTWLLNLKIIDPACGSGAFLNEALEFLINEHEILKSEMSSAGNIFYAQDIEISILENNLYGVDINSEAVEIAKLSLWLRTAKKGRKLTKLANNLKCANSLLQMPFELNSFDCVIGNPPYVRQELIKEQKPGLEKIYKVYAGTADLFVYFYELGFNLLKQNGILGFICSNKFFRAKYGQNLRSFILQNFNILNIADFTGVKIFEDALVDSTINIFQKSEQKEENEFKFYDKQLENFTLLKQNSLSEQNFTFANQNEQAIKEKIEKIGTKLKDWDIKINYGIKTGFNEAFIIDENIKNELIKQDEKSKELIKPILRGRDIKRYSYEFANLYIINSHNNPPINIEEFLAIKNHLDKFYKELEKRTDKGQTPYNLRNCAYLEEFEKEKIVFSEIVKEPQFYLDNEKFYSEATGFLLTGKNLKYLLVLLNCKFITFVFKKFYMGTELGSEGLRYKKSFLEQLPIPQISQEEQIPFEQKADLMLSLNADLQSLKQNFIKELEVEKIPTKLANFEDLSFDEFIKEFAKAKKIKFADKLTERNFKQDWQAIFENDKNEVLKLKETITKTDNEINQMVYKLYDLTEEEIKIVQSSS